MKKSEEESEASSGMLFSSGLIAGGALAGLGVGLLAMVPMGGDQNLLQKMDLLERFGGAAFRAGAGGNLVALLIFLALCWVLYRVGKTRDAV